MPLTFLTRVALVSLLIGQLRAHDLYILPDAFYVTPGTTLGIGFHSGDAFPESEAAPHTDRLKDAQLRSGETTVSVQNLRLLGKRVIGSAAVPDGRGDLLLSVRTVPNLIELPADQFLAYLKEEGLTNVIGWREQHGESKKAGRERYSKFAKSILLAGKPDDGYRLSLGFPLEIIPDANPYALRAGEGLPVRVLFRGAPAADLQLEAAWAGGRKSQTVVVGRTDAGGRIRVPITAAGKWRLHSLKMERCADPAAADWESAWASLTFEIPEN